MKNKILLLILGVMSQIPTAEADSAWSSYQNLDVTECKLSANMDKALTPLYFDAFVVTFLLKRCVVVNKKWIWEDYTEPTIAVKTFKFVGDHDGHYGTGLPGVMDKCNQKRTEIIFNGLINPLRSKCWKQAMAEKNQSELKAGGN